MVAFRSSLERSAEASISFQLGFISFSARQSIVGHPGSFVGPIIHRPFRSENGLRSIGTVFTDNNAFEKEWKPHKNISQKQEQRSTKINRMQVDHCVPPRFVCFSRCLLFVQPCSSSVHSCLGMGFFFIVSSYKAIDFFKSFSLTPFRPGLFFVRPFMRTKKEMSHCLSPSRHLSSVAPPPSIR